MTSRPRSDSTLVTAASSAAVPEPVSRTAVNPPFGANASSSRERIDCWRSENSGSRWQMSSRARAAKRSPGRGSAGSSRDPERATDAAGHLLRTPGDPRSRRSGRAERDADEEERGTFTGKERRHLGGERLGRLDASDPAIAGGAGDLVQADGTGDRRLRARRGVRAVVEADVEEVRRLPCGDRREAAEVHKDVAVAVEDEDAPARLRERHADTD